MLETYIDGLRLKERRLQNTKTAFFATDAHLREIRPFILSPDAQVLLEDLGTGHESRLVKPDLP